MYGNNIESCIESLCKGEGHTWIPENYLRKKVNLNGMDELLKSGDVCCAQKADGRYVFALKDFCDKEEATALNIGIKLSQKVPKISDADINKFISMKEIETGSNLDEHQKDAVRMACKYPFMVLTGGPGTGKTFTLNTIDYALRHIFPDITICYTAPTGKAAKRITESTGNPASTLHKKLEIMEGKLEPVSISEDVLIVDESSMLDIDIAYSLFKAVKEKSRLILVGDIDQLPSVGPGAILRDLIACGLIPVTKLTKTFRQKGESLIIDNMKNVRDGIQHMDVGNDFIITRPDDIRKIYTNEEFLVGSYIAKAIEYGIDNVALLTPYRKAQYETGAEHLNNVIQSKIQPQGARSLWTPDHRMKFMLNDRVMQLKNRMECANGDIGEVIEIDNSSIRIAFPEENVTYTQSELDQLSLAYCMSIHKSQGSEYKAVISCMLKEHAMMCQRNLLYTAITRAKKDFILLGEDEAIQKAIDTEASCRRCTMFQEKIRLAAKYFNIQNIAA